MSNLGNKRIMAQNILFYMARDKKTRSDMCAALNVPYTTFTDWVKGNAYPRIDKIEAMANYFGITKADLVEEKPTPVSESGPISPERQALLDAVKDVDNDTAKAVLDIIRSVKKLRGE